MTWPQPSVWRIAIEIRLLGLSSARDGVEVDHGLETSRDDVFYHLHR
jgi:hypothetical protein